MSRRREIRRHLDALGELRGILAAMRTLALAEIARLGRFATAQRRMVGTIERAAADLFAFAPAPPAAGGALPGLVAFGSERGFCGGFNETVAAALPGDGSALVVVGRRLAARIPAGRTAAVVDGASAAEEIPSVVARLAAAMSDLPGRDWSLLHHDPEARALRRANPLAALGALRAPLGPFPPRTYVAPHALAAALVAEYLPAVLLDAAYASFLAENHDRLRQMEGALDRLDARLRGESRRLNALRQEEITEEIEILLLGASAD